jgi:predicted pyridoxine 5'-phosphate oxidase superfamily flavin-nucleotide-binding protein
MADRFDAETFTPDVLAAQRTAHGHVAAAPPAVEPDALGPEEILFLEERDSFYMATVNQNGWPYLQHRGGPPGFVHVLGPTTIAFADRKGNRRLVSTGNVTGNDRVALMFMDYPNRRRLKLLGHARVLGLETDPALTSRLLPTPAQRRSAERIFVIEVVGLDWNCPAYITPRYTEAEMRGLHEPE